MPDAAPKPKKQRFARTRQIREAYVVTRRNDPKIGWILLAIMVGVFGAMLALGFVIGQPLWLGLLGFSVALLVTTIVFGRRAEAAAIHSIEGQPGAAAAVLNSLRKGYTVTPAVAVTRNQDIVHRVTSRAGVVLIGEGAPSRLANLMANERRKTQRVIGDAPLHELIVGTGPGEVPLRKLSSAVMKLPRTLRPSEVTDLNYRLKALGAMQQPVPIPKGPLPKGAKLPKMPT
jgi:hypothetical protein